MIKAKLQQKWAKGFTLIETLVAVLILALALTGPYAIAARGLSASLIAKDQTIAFYLAQDAVEYVRFLRDGNKLAGRPWLSGMDGAAGCVSADGGSACYLDSLSQSPAVPTSCNAATCSLYPLYIDGASQTYTYFSSFTQKSIFTRTVTITTPVNGNTNEAALRVTVNWQDVGGVARKVVVEEHLFDWQ